VGQATAARHMSGGRASAARAASATWSVKVKPFMTVAPSAAIPEQRGVRYELYLTTDAWQMRRRYLIAQAGNRCRLCNDTGTLQLHHRTYGRVGHERPEDLIVLCKPCHEHFHRGRSIKR
jgi:hypothetical protein